ncbi:MAG TPA: hypothetical protein VNM92_15660 [Thermoanaerobaculia bacterium]|nr:hypothetical protein [Thermoanaerobaculia bacterium]
MPLESTAKPDELRPALAGASAEFGDEPPTSRELAFDFALAFAVVAIVVIAAGATAPEGESRDWRAYLAAGTLSPLLIVAVNAMQLAPRTRYLLRYGGAFVAGLVAVRLLLTQMGLVSIVGAAVTIAVAGELRGVSLRRAPPHWFAIAAAWLAASTLLWWWQPLPQSLLSYGLGATLAASLAALLFCRQREAHISLAARMVAFAAPLMFFIAATRADRLDNFGAFHHWSFLVGPAELLRAHGWLLWDLPSQYGFLSMLTLAVAPGANRFQALYLLNVALLTACATFAWYALQRSRPDWLGRIISLLATTAAFFLVSGSAQHLSGPMEYPSTGPFRFLWVYAILAILLWNFVTEGRHRAAVQLAGAVVWAVGSLWSFESWAYVTATWIPASILLAMAVKRERSAARALKIVLAGPLVLAFAIIIINLFYGSRLGQSHDLRGFWEFSLAYSGQYGTLPAALVRPWIALALVLAIGATVAAPLIRARDYLALSLVAASWGATWSTASYYVARSHPNNVTNLTPIGLTATACIVYVARERLGGASRLIGAMAAAIPAFLIMIPLMNPGQASNAIHASLVGYDTNVARQFPPEDPALTHLMRLAKVPPDEPMAFLGAAAAPLLKRTERGRTLYRTRPSLIPAIPSILLDAIPQARRLEYLDRYMTSDTTQRGWLVRGRGKADMRLRFDGRTAAQIERDDHLVIGKILQFYEITAASENEQWQLIRLQRRQTPRAAK